MADYILRDNLYIEFVDIKPCLQMGNQMLYTQKEIAELILKQPTTDVLPVVRCKDCMFWNGKYCSNYFERDVQTGENLGQCFMGPDDFCSYGARKDGGGGG